MATLLDERRTIDLPRLERAVRELLEAIGEDPDRDGLRETPSRVARLYQELFSGLSVDPREFIKTAAEETHQNWVLVRDVSFFSMCEHHLLPFFGRAHVGYIPDGRLVGLSKIGRTVDGYAQRPQIQERLTDQIADGLFEKLGPDGLAVVLEAEHLCMTMRGVKKPGSLVVTSATRGPFSKGVIEPSAFASLVCGG